MTRLKRDRTRLGERIQHLLGLTRISAPTWRTFARRTVNTGCNANRTYRRLKVCASSSHQGTGIAHRGVCRTIRRGTLGNSGRNGNWIRAPAWSTSVGNVAWRSRGLIIDEKSDPQVVPLVAFPVVHCPCVYTPAFMVSALNERILIYRETPASPSGSRRLLLLRCTGSRPGCRCGVCRAQPNFDPSGKSVNKKVFRVVTVKSVCVGVLHGARGRRNGPGRLRSLCRKPTRNHKWKSKKSQSSQLELSKSLTRRPQNTRANFSTRI